MSRALGPISFEPILVAKPWGGQQLATLGKVIPDDRTYGESWEVADLDPAAVGDAEQSRSVVNRGPHRGATLGDLMSELGADLMGSVASSRQFPLLLKYLDAGERLSVQVHPDADAVARDPGSSLKTESWYVVAAQPDAQLYLGLTEGVESGDLKRRAGTGAMVELLRRVPAVPGEFHHLPAGLVHALGAGVVVAEPQTPSDTTYRLYDWTDEYEREPRQLHLASGLGAARIDVVPDVARAQTSDGHRSLIETAHYSIVEHRSSAGTVDVDPRAELRILMVIHGEVIVAIGSQDPIRASAGQTLMIPAVSISELTVDVAAPTTILEISLV